MATSQQELLDSFVDNDTNRIQAVNLRDFVNALYADALIVEGGVVDVFTDDQGVSRALSASRGYNLNMRLATAEATIIALEARIEALENP